jgi:hypothetical protein
VRLSGYEYDEITMKSDECKSNLERMSCNVTGAGNDEDLFADGAGTSFC